MRIDEIIKERNLSKEEFEKRVLEWEKTEEGIKFNKQMTTFNSIVKETARRIFEDLEKGYRGSVSYGKGDFELRCFDEDKFKELKNKWLGDDE